MRCPKVLSEPQEECGLETRVSGGYNVFLISVLPFSMVSSNVFH